MRHCYYKDVFIGFETSLLPGLYVWRLVGRSVGWSACHNFLYPSLRLRIYVSKTLTITNPGAEGGIPGALQEHHPRHGLRHL